MLRVANKNQGAPDMVWIDGGRFQMGSDHHYPEEAPSRAAAVDGFWIAPHPVTNAQFAHFVRQTGWVTVAETGPDPKDYPGVGPDRLIPASVVFDPPTGPVDVSGRLVWWNYIPGANWRHPYGPGSGIGQIMDHPVVHVALADVEAYAAWAGLDLPTEAEWEFAARGGLEGAEFAWGDAFTPGGRQMANTWQGRFPVENLELDGYERTSPVGAYPANGYGLYDMIGNVWEWTRDWWSIAGPVAATPCCCAAKNPRGGDVETSHDPADERLRIPRRVLKGGSHLCAPNYCRRYRPAARHAHPIDTSTSHIGFRCVLRVAS